MTGVVMTNVLASTVAEGAIWVPVLAMVVGALVWLIWMDA